MTTPTRRHLIAASGAALVAAPHVARAQNAPIRWRMITSWTKNLPGPGVSAERLAQRINRLSGGRMLVEVLPAGSIVPAFGVFEAISTGVAEMGHTASFFWDGKLPGAALFTTAPFGLPPLEHQTWIEQRGGQQMWDAFYKPHGVRGLLAGNTGPSMGGWFRKPITSLDDIAGLRNERGNVVGLMPHPEHAVEPGFGPDTATAMRSGVDGLKFFTSVLKAVVNA